MSYANPSRQNRQDARQKAQSQQNSRRRNRGGSNQQEPAATTPSTTPAAAAAASSSTAPAATASAPAAVQQGQGGGSFSTVPGQLIYEGLGGLTQWGNTYGKDNETVGGLVHGAIADIYKTQANTGLAIQYNDSFLDSLGKYQAGQEDLKTGNTMKLMGVEGALASNLLGRQGEEQRANYREEGEQTRLGYRTQGEEQRAGYRTQGEEQRAGYRTMGEQERLTQGDKTNQELRLRADARGAIRSQGARFYG